MDEEEEDYDDCVDDAEGFMLGVADMLRAWAEEIKPDTLREDTEE